MSSIYHAVYYALCESHKVLKSKYQPKSGLHQHHIIPKHQGGGDYIQNYTYLTSYEHAFAHYLLWEMNHNPNDLRSMNMLGVNLSPEQRKIVGEYCRDNQIGIFNPEYKDMKKDWSMLGFLQQKQHYEVTGDTNNFYWWSTKEGRQRRSSLGGKAAAATQIKNQVGIFTDDKDKQKHWASLGGKSHKGKKAMYRPGDSTFKRVTPKDFEYYLSIGYIFGSPFKSQLGNHQPKPNKKKKVTDGSIIFDGVKDAAEYYEISPSAICYRCNSKKQSNWSYVSET